MSARIDRSTAPARRSTVSPAERAIALRRAASANSAISVSPKSSASRDGERAAGVIESRVGVGEICDHRPVQNGAGELGGLDRILPAAADERLADEHDAGQAIEQPEFADRVADVDRRPGPHRVAARAQRANEALRLQLAQDRFAPLGMAGRDQGQRVGEHLAQTLVRIRRDHLLAVMRRGGDPDLAPRREARRARRARAGRRAASARRT